MPLSYLIDTNVLMYAAGREHRYREPCRAWLRAVATGAVNATIDVEVIQEILYRGARFSGARGAEDAGGADRGGADAGVGAGPTRSTSAWADELARAALDLFPEPLAFGPEACRRVVEIVAQHADAGVHARDAVHAAIAEVNEISTIVSADRHFDVLSTVQRLDPTERVPEGE